MSNRPGPFPNAAAQPPVRRRSLRRLLVAGVALILAVLVALQAAAVAHSLDSSTIAVRVTDESVEMTISVAIETLDEALGTDYLETTGTEALSADVHSYLAEHLVVTGADSTTWSSTYSEIEREVVEGIDSIRVVVAFGTGDSDLDRFVIDYDAIIEAIPTHEAVVVLTDSNGDISTPGIITASNPTLTVTDGQASVPVSDMIHYGLEHVLEGADHLLFLSTLLLPAPLVVAAGRWRPGGGPRPTLKRVVHVITAFTIGHSVTLIASALGWVNVPTRPVEVIIAASVGVSALHCLRPLATHGEEAIAVGFGLVHGLAFAGILRDLGLQGTTSLVSLLSFNVGIELAQLLTAAVVFPSLYVLSTTRFYPAFRVVGASLALAAATGWGLDRLGVLTNPFAALEDAAITNPWLVVTGLAAVAVVARLASAGLDARRVPTNV